MFHLISLAQLDITPLNNNKTSLLKSDMGPFFRAGPHFQATRVVFVFFFLINYYYFFFFFRNKNCRIGKAHKWQGKGRTLARTGVIT